MIVADEVGVILDVDVETYIRNLARAETEFSARLAKMSANATKAGTAWSVPADHAVRAFQTVTPEIDKFDKSVQESARHTGNLVAQFNDVGVSLLSGQGSWIVAIQQGTQLNQVFDDLRRNGSSLGGALGGAFSSFLNPLNFATIAVIGLGGEALKYFMDVIMQGGEANLTLEQQAQIIRSVADRWGDAVPALREYADELDAMQNRIEEGKAIEIFRDDAFEEARKGLEDLTITFADFQSQLEDAGSETETMTGVNDAFNQYKLAVQEGKDATEAFNNVMRALDAASRDQAIPAIDDFRSSISSLNDVVDSANAKVERLLNQMVTAGTKLGALSPLFSEDGKFLSGDDFTPPGTAPTPTRRPLDLDRYPDGGFNKPRQTRAKKEQLDEYEQFTRKTREQTEALEAEYDAMLNLDPLIKDYGLAQNTAKLYQEGLNAAKRAGIELGPKERENLMQLAEGLATVRAEQKKYQEEQRETLKQIEEWNNLAKSTMGGFINDLIQGKNAAESFRNALGKIADQLIKIGLSNIFDSGKGNLLGGFFSSIFGGGASDPWAGMRANGGPVVPGQAYVVGEKRPEVFVPGVAGSILPRVPSVSSPASSGGYGGDMAVRVYVDDEDKLRAMVDRRSGKIASSLVERSQAGEVSRLPGNLQIASQRGIL